MEFVFCLIWILLFGREDRIVQGLNETNQNSNWILQRDLNNSQCLPPCYGGVESIIVVEAIPNTIGVGDVPLSESSLDTIYKKCEDRYLQFDYDPSKNLLYKRFCGYMKYDCQCPVMEKKNKWQLGPNEQKLLLWVNLLITDNTKIIRIRTQRCGENPMVLNFKREKKINYHQNYDSNHSGEMNLTSFPLTLSLNESEYKEIVIDVVFDTTIPEIRACSKVNEKYCKHLCQNNHINPDVKCIIQVGYKDVEIENMDNVCSSKSFMSKTTEKVGNGMCEYFRLNNIRPCEHICIDMPGCSYMCVQEYESQITEMGYQERALLNHYGLVGSGHWSAADIPDHLVLVDECKYNSKLCTNASSCRDTVNGYECINDDYNMIECIINGKSRFWHCPENQISYNNSTSSSDSFVYSFYDIVKRKMDLKIKLPKMFSELSNQNKASKKWNPSTRKDVSNYVLKEVEKVFQNFSVKTLNKDKPVYNQCTDSFDAYSSVVNETEEEHTIPVVESESLNDTQFVKFHIQDNDRFASDNKDLISNFIRYKDLDMVDESAEIDSHTKINGIFENSGFNVSGKDFVERYKNSDVIYLALNQNRNVTIKFKLKTSFKHTSPSWLYSFEDECGFLDRDGSWEWSVEGCSKKWLSDKDYYCECDHLSNFAMLFSIKMVNEKHLTVFRYLSVIGATINIISLILFLIFVLLINSRDKLRLDQLNIAICLLLGTFVFLMGKYTSRNITLCKLTALSTQFLFLSAFIWKLILGINVVRMIASLRYQNEDWMVKYRLAAVAVGYGVPLTIVMFSGGFLWIYYGKISDEVCWIQSSSNAFLTFLIPIGIILAVNLMILFFIANTLIRNYIKTHKTKVNESNELLVFLQLVVAMGLTWLPSYLATIYLAAMYLWVIFFPLQGLMMFLFVVVINRENREKVSTFVLQRYSSLISKSTVSTDAKSQSKSKSSGEYKSTEQCQSLISQTDKENNVSNFPMVVVTDQDECRVPLQNSTC